MEITGGITGVLQDTPADSISRKIEKKLSGPINGLYPVREKTAGEIAAESLRLHSILEDNCTHRWR